MPNNSGSGAGQFTVSISDLRRAEADLATLGPAPALAAMVDGSGDLRAILDEATVASLISIAQRTADLLTEAYLVVPAIGVGLNQTAQMYASADVLPGGGAGQ